MNAEIVSIKDLNTELLAPGASPGRIVLFTEGAIARLKEENLFTEKIKVVKKVVDKKVGVKPININTKINTPKENNKKAEVLKK
jgi:hypothetical protein